MKKVQLPTKKKKEILKESSYESTHVVSPLKLLFIIVNRNQGQFYIKALSELHVGATFEIYGYGTAPKEIYSLLETEDYKKDLVIGVVNTCDIEKIMHLINERFSVSKLAKGVAFTIPLDSMAGVVFYKYFTNNRSIKENQNGK